MPDWLKERLPQALRPADEVAPSEFTLDKYADVLASARKVGKVAGYLPGSKHIATEANAASLSLFENIIRAMSDVDKKNLAAFGRFRREQVAQQVDCDVAKVDECIAKYMFMRAMLQRVEENKREGKPLPQNLDEIEKTVGATWQNFRDASSEEQARAAQQGAGQSNVQHPPPATSVLVPKDAVARSGEPCPLAGQTIGRRTTCPLTQKKYKACCGKSPPAGVAFRR